VVVTSAAEVEEAAMRRMPTMLMTEIGLNCWAVLKALEVEAKEEELPMSMSSLSMDAGEGGRGENVDDVSLFSKSSGLMEEEEG
jgi:hypothetical protein